jgi:hypothetical protein
MHIQYIVIDSVYPKLMAELSASSSLTTSVNIHQDKTENKEKSEKDEDEAAWKDLKKKLKSSGMATSAAARMMMVQTFLTEEHLSQNNLDRNDHAMSYDNIQQQQRRRQQQRLSLTWSSETTSMMTSSANPMKNLLNQTSPPRIKKHQTPSLIEHFSKQFSTSTWDSSSYVDERTNCSFPIRNTEKKSKINSSSGNLLRRSSSHFPSYSNSEFTVNEDPYHQNLRNLRKNDDMIDGSSSTSPMSSKPRSNTSKHTTTLFEHFSAFNNSNNSQTSPRRSSDAKSVSSLPILSKTRLSQPSSNPNSSPEKASEARLQAFASYVMDSLPVASRLSQFHHKTYSKKSPTARSLTPPASQNSTSHSYPTTIKRSATEGGRSASAFCSLEKRGHSIQLPIESRNEGVTTDLERNALSIRSKQDLTIYETSLPAHLRRKEDLHQNHSKLKTGKELLAAGIRKKKILRMFRNESELDSTQDPAIQPISKNDSSDLSHLTISQPADSRNDPSLRNVDPSEDGLGMSDKKLGTNTAVNASQHISTCHPSSDESTDPPFILRGYESTEIKVFENLSGVLLEDFGPRNQELLEDFDQHRRRRSIDTFPLAVTPRQPLQHQEHLQSKSPPKTTTRRLSMDDRFRSAVARIPIALAFVSSYNGNNLRASAESFISEVTDTMATEDDDDERHFQEKKDNHCLDHNDNSQDNSTLASEGGIAKAPTPVTAAPSIDELFPKFKQPDIDDDAYVGGLLFLAPDREASIRKKFNGETTEGDGDEDGEADDDVESKSYDYDKCMEVTEVDSASDFVGHKDSDDEKSAQGIRMTGMTTASVTPSKKVKKTSKKGKSRMKKSDCPIINELK